MSPRAELTRLLADLQPAEMALRDWIAPLLDTSMIDELATADYGSDVDEHRRAIGSLLAADRLPEQLEWHPSEVLELIRWSMPDDPAWRPGSQGRRGHLLRLFSCMVLVRAATGQDPTDSLAPLVESALDLGPDAVQATLRFLAWCRLNEPGDWRDQPTARPFLTFALILLCAATSPPDESVALAELTRTLVDELDALQASVDVAGTIQDTPPLLGLNRHNQHHKMWGALTARCLIEGAAADTNLGSRLSLLGQAVRGDVTASITDLRTLFTTDPDP